MSQPGGSPPKSPEGPHDGNIYAVTGRVGTGVHPRLSIEELQSTKPKQFTLFILAYSKLQGVDSTLVPGDVPLAVTFPEIASIHGLPYTPWAGDNYEGQDTRAHYHSKDPKDTDPVPARSGGYCNHGSILFPTWHRPYVMAIEQGIGEVAERIAATFAEKYGAEADQWITAAHELRFPYWDFADARVGIEGFPPVMYTLKVKITMPGSTIVEVDNPLATYKFKSIPDGFTNVPSTTNGVTTTAYYADWRQTLRHAASDPNATESDIADLNKSLKEQAASLRRKVALLFACESEGKSGELIWDEFSNHTTQSLGPSDFTNTDSLEGVHDVIHGLVGGNGHMADPDIAGFDPFFYLHHCFVDKLLALWEYVYPDYYMGESYTLADGTTHSWIQAQGTYATVYNAQAGGTAILAPFRTRKIPEGSKDGKPTFDYWTSDDARFLTPDAKVQKYYTYGEVAGVKVDRPSTHEERVKYRAALQQHYGLAPQKDQTRISHASVKCPQGHTQIMGYRHVIVVIQTPEFAFDGSYIINVYYTNSKKEREFVGSVAVFARQEQSACEGCKARRHVGSMVRGVVQIPQSVINDLLSSLGDAGPQLDAETLSAALKEKFEAEIVGKNTNSIGTAKGTTSADGLDAAGALSRHSAPKFTILSSAVMRPEGDPNGPVKWFDWRHHGDVFSGGHRAWRTQSQ